MIFALRKYAEKPFIDVPILIHSLYMYTFKSAGLVVPSCSICIVWISILWNYFPYLVDLGGKVWDFHWESQVLGTCESHRSAIARHDHWRVVRETQRIRKLPKNWQKGNLRFFNWARKKTLVVLGICRGFLLPSFDRVYNKPWSKDPYEPTSIMEKVGGFFFVAQWE